MSARGWIALAAFALATSAFASTHSSKKVSGVVNLNDAPLDQLNELPGMSMKAAQAIVDYRMQQPFERVEDLAKVKGFGAKRFEKLKDHLAISGESTLKVEQVAKAKKSNGKSKAKSGKGRKSKKKKSSKHKHAHSTTPVGGQGRRHRSSSLSRLFRTHRRTPRHHSPRIGLGGSVRVSL